MYPGVWRHGDWIRITERGSAVIEGRSDSTLNRQGIRFGTSELYGVVESLPEIADSLVIGLELPGGRYRMPLFVVLADGVELDDALKGSDQRGDQGRPVAAPRPRRDRRGARRPAHADRQEDGGAGEAAPPGSSAGRRRCARAPPPTPRRSTGSPTTHGRPGISRTDEQVSCGDGSPGPLAPPAARRRHRRPGIVGQEQRGRRGGARGRLPVL